MQEKDLTAADIWKMFEKTEQIIQETALRQEEAARRHEDMEKLFKAQNLKTDRILRKLSHEISGLGRNAGLHAEQYFQDALGDSLVFGGQKYDNIIPNLKYQRKKVNAEFDIVLVNGKSVALIEAKNRIHKDFVKELAEKKLVCFKKYFPKFCKCDVYLGIAGFSFEEGVFQEAKERGIGVIRQVGKSIEMSADKLKAY